MNEREETLRTDYNTRLEAQGIYPTPQRVAVARVLLERYQHLTADEIYDRVRRSDNVSKATIYNTLALFSRKGLIREIVADPARIFYDSNTSPHHHFFNIDTGTLSDIESELHPAPAPESFPPGTELHSVDVVVRLRNTPAATRAD
ncbi:MAG: transcriptional repressor [Gammaproteobacteria bacterium RIFOXYA12_FULL_61_12]|nr:MAG: transcriptional repressor [Gammaproteobacteria bacterium RIFOXYD12_FULL_61_37]OGT93826.1 MAG: transcriptional repressor [Gammaproteobacteria bacterium RIFOXYA12_FULL_61_12]